MYAGDGMSRVTCEIRSLIIERETSSWVLTKLSPFWRRATCTNMGCKSASVIRTSVCIKIIKKLSYNYSHFTWNLPVITSAFYAEALWVPIDRHAISWEEEWRDESKERLRRLDLPNNSSKFPTWKMHTKHSAVSRVVDFHSLVRLVCNLGSMEGCIQPREWCTNLPLFALVNNRNLV